MASSRKILTYLGSLAPRGTVADETAENVVRRQSDFLWLGQPELRNFVGSPTTGEAPGDSPAVNFGNRNPGDYSYGPRISHRGLARLVATDAIDPTRHLLRFGWIWVIGERQNDQGDQVSVQYPVVSLDVRLRETTTANTFMVEAVSDPEIHARIDPVLTDEERETLLSSFGSYPVEIVSDALQRLNYPTVLPIYGGREPRRSRSDGTVGDRPDSMLKELPDVILLGAGAAAYLHGQSSLDSFAAGVENWIKQDVSGTSIEHIYGVTKPAQAEEPPDPSNVYATMPLNLKQRTAVARSRTEPVSVISGPPGTGKSHLVAAAAVDAIARGQSVLIATHSRHATDSICELLDRYPTPSYIRFGTAENRQKAIDMLSDGFDSQPTKADLDQIVGLEERHRAEVSDARQQVWRSLELEQGFEAGLRNRGSFSLDTADAPAVTADGFDFAEAQELLKKATDTDGLFAGARRKRALGKLQELTQASDTTPVETIRTAIEAAEAERGIEQVVRSGGITLDKAWAELESLEDRWRETLGQYFEINRRWQNAFGPDSRSSAAALATVLRSDAGHRFQKLSELDTNFLNLLPMWVGTLDEIERTLPVAPGAFDLLILDEASQIDQLKAVGALCRAKRAMIVGDPRQLRHKSDVPDEEMETALDSIGIDDLTQRQILDVSRNSIFDVAASASGVTWLDEHFRCAPHLIDFSSRNFYSEQLLLMTAHPAVEDVDSIDQLRIKGERADGVNAAEIEAVKTQLQQMLAAGGRASVGVLTPFGTQAEAMETMLVDTFTLAEIDQLGLRSGTAHTFQGSERDTIIVSLGIVSDDFGSLLEVIEDPALFNVMVTRAKSKIVLLHSFDPAGLPAGLLRQYFLFADKPPPFTGGGTPAAGWTTTVAESLGASGDRVVANYPVAGIEVDLAFGEGPEAFGVECTVHPNGPDAHIDRHLTLRRAGWHMVDAFESKWMLKPEQLAAHLGAKLNRRRTS